MKNWAGSDRGKEEREKKRKEEGRDLIVGGKKASNESKEAKKVRSRSR